MLNTPATVALRPLQTLKNLLKYSPMYLTKHGIAPETVIEKSADSVLLEFSVPEACDFFEGHFPEIKLLPAVAQIDLMAHFSKKYFGVPIGFSGTKRTKFGAPIFPNAIVRMNIKFNSEKNSVTYKLSNTSGEKIYSTGTFALIGEDGGGYECSGHF